MRSLLLILTFVGIMAATAMAGDTWPSTIPDRLATCYDRGAMSNRYRRMPNSIDNLVAIIRKIETHPETALWSAGKMASTLLKRFRYDGIIDLADVGNDVLPIVNDPSESSKYKMQWKIVPGSASGFPESALTNEEKCSLHWMLSYSVNRTRRAEEAVLSRSLPAGNADASSEEQGDKENHETHVGGDDKSHEPEEIPEVSDPEEHPEHDSSHEEVEPEPIPEEAEERQNNDVIDEDNTDVDSDHGSHVVNHDEDPTAEEETHDPEPEQPVDPVDEDYPVEETRVDSEDSENSEWRRRKRSIRKVRDTSARADLPQSNQPLEVGVVHTKWGAVAIGSVISGIAAGTQPQSAKLREIISSPPAFEISESSLDRTAESTWLATLSGEIAQSALLKVSKGMASVGPAGEWNSTFCPREYKLSIKETSFLSYAELYGGIDGLLMSKRVATWDSSSYMKLSSILEMYYSDNGIFGDAEYRACNRLNNYKDPNKVDQAMLKEQALNGALIMYAKGIPGAPTFKPGTKPVDQIGQYVNTTMREIDAHLNDYSSIGVDFPNQCSSQPSSERTPATYSDVTFVIDQNTDPMSISKQKELAASLAALLDIQAGGSRMEVVSSKDGAQFTNMNTALNRAELACLISDLNIPASERRIATTLATLRERIKKERSGEKANRVGGGNTRAIIFFTMSGTTEADKIKLQLEAMIKEMKDVYLMFVTVGRPEDYRGFVSNFNRDVISMSSFATYKDAAPVIAKTLASIAARYSYPACSDVIKPGTAPVEPLFVYTGYLNPRSVQYFRLGPEHFHKSESLTLRFKTSFGVARYCISNEKDREMPGTGNCKSPTTADETVEFKLPQPCGKMIGPLGCNAVYISVESVDIEDNIPCSDKECHTPDQVKFTFTHEGLKCSGCMAVLSNFVLLVALITSWFSYNHH